MNDATLLCTIYIYGEHKPKIFEHFAAKRSKSFARTRSKTPAVGGDDAREAAAAAALGQSKRPPPPLGSGGHLMQMAQRKRQHEREEASEQEGEDEEYSEEEEEEYILKYMSIYSIICIYIYVMCTM